MTNDQLIQQLRRDLSTNLDHGIECPVCLRYSKRYVRTITPSMVSSLMILSRYKRFVKLESILKKEKNVPTELRGDFHKLRYWDLIEKSKERKGFYKITEKGRNFVAGQYKVNQNAHVFRNRVYWFSGKRISVDNIGE